MRLVSMFIPLSDVKMMACLLPVEAGAQQAVWGSANLLQSEGLGSTSGWWLMAVLS